MKRKLALVSLFTVLIAGIETTAAPRSAMQAAQVAQVALPQQGPAEVRVQLGKSLLITSQEDLQRVSVTDPTVASAVVVSSKQVLIHGLKAGTGTLILWDEQERPRSFNVSVELDVTSLRQSMNDMFPGEPLQAVQSGAALVLTGNVSSKTVSDRAAALAGTISPQVVNLITVIEGHQVIQIQVKFAEIDRTALQQLGLTLISTGAANMPGIVSTHQFDSQNAGFSAAGGSASGAAAVVGGKNGSIGFSDVLNLFLFRPDLNLGAAVRALQQQNVLQILAEPNVMAINGTESSFLAGGEFPFPVVQGGSNNAVTVQFKEFGIRLNFVPHVMPNGVIRLKVAPEVSALDFANGLTVSGFLVPALTSRKATTEVELKDGQSFAIAGLIDNRTTEVASKIPGLSNIPLIGNLFKSRAINKSNTELLVMVTPRLVEPQNQAPTLPEFPKSFIDPKNFDGKADSTNSK